MPQEHSPAFPTSTATRKATRKATGDFSIFDFECDFDSILKNNVFSSKLGGSIFQHNKNSAAPCLCALVLVCRRRIKELCPPRALPANDRKKQTACASLTQDDVQSRWGENMKNILPCMRLLFWCSQQQHKYHAGAR